jgi:oligopeptide/dipeptide ABC transporter ATP-binding protein
MEPVRRKIQYIFQDPYSSLNPRMTVGSILAEPFVIHGIGTDVTRRAAAVRLLEMVGLGAQHLNRYPHSFSGGQRQRIGIARSLALQPDLVICDEPVSALDVSIQAQILNLLRNLQKDFALTYVFISHDLSVIRQIADRIAVMYLGHIVELGDSESIYEHPKHPYTAALLSAVPRATTGGRERIVLAGDVPSPVDPPPACVFHPRCPRFHQGHCDVEEPLLRELATNQYAACHYPLEKWPMTDDEIRQAEGALRADKPHLEGAAQELG